ncbi:trypsin-like serine peptidase [Novosphingobium sp.]|uniref:trypsin-like serine peptidase n=1 Tax=Novosphingobium sp. TaxID=1874826 RepID=UPI002FE366AB
MPSLETDTPTTHLSGGDFALDVVTPTGAAWKAVPFQALHQLPFATVGRLELYDQGGLFGAGTAWLAGHATAVTAAHNFRPPGGGAIKQVRLLFPTLTQAIVAQDARIHPQYRGMGAIADPWDVACVRLQPLNLPLLAINDPGPPAALSAYVTGFPNGQSNLVSHTAKAFRAHDTLMVHSIDTATGHSGAPMILVGAPASAIAIHVGGFASNPFAAKFPSANTALPLRPALVAFIQQHIDQWG